MPMRMIVALFLLTLAALAHAGQGAEYVNSYFELWLKDHKFTAFEKRSEGIYFPKNGVLLDGEIHEAKALREGVLYSVETRISLKFSDGRRLDDFVAGGGAKPDAAFLDSINNFCLTTLHPVYAALFDHSDPHVRKAQWTIDGVQRPIFLSDWGQRGEKVADATQKQVESLIKDEISKIDLSRGLHWAKLVVLTMNGKLETVVVTIDGEQNEGLTERLLQYKWPVAKEFSMAKLFFVVGEEQPVD